MLKGAVPPARGGPFPTPYAIMLPRFIRVVVGAALASFVSVAPRVDAQVPVSEYAARRAALLATLDSGVVIAHGEVEPVTDWPPFFQLPHFHYLTGFDESNAALLMVKRAGATTTSMFVPQQAEFMARVLGKRTPAAGLERAIGIAGRDIGGLRPTVDPPVALG